MDKSNEKNLIKLVIITEDPQVFSNEPKGGIKSIKRLLKHIKLEHFLKFNFYLLSYIFIMIINQFLSSSLEERVSKTEIKI